MVEGFNEIKLRLNQPYIPSGSRWDPFPATASITQRLGEGGHPLKVSAWGGLPYWLRPPGVHSINKPIDRLVTYSKRR
jgi:hypothetical protein